MRWVKHLTCANRDEKMTQLMDDCGVVAYGIYWLIVETVGESLEKGGTEPAVTHSMKQWGRALHTHPNRLRPVLDSMGQIGLIRVQCDGDRVRVEIPNLLKYRDEYGTRKSKCRDSVPTKDTEAETEADTKAETEKEPSSGCLPFPETPEPETEPKPVDPLGLAITAAAIEIHARHPRQNDRRDLSANAIAAKLRTIANTFRASERIGKVAEIDARHARWCQTEGWKTGYAKAISNWISPRNKLWEAEPSTEEESATFPQRRSRVLEAFENA